MLSLFVLLIVLISLRANGTATNEEETKKALLEIQAKINDKVAPFCYHGHSGSKQAFITNRYGEQTGNINALVYPFCLMTNELGNRLGNFFTEVGCSQAAGLHFIAVHPQWDIAGSFHGNNTNNTYRSDSSKLAFLKALPSVIVHPNPLDRFKATYKLHHECKCTRYCWEHGNAPWVNKTDLIGGYIRDAVAAFMGSVDTSMGTVVDSEVDLTNAPPGQILPIVPTVALQYRCGDNLGFSYMYGILPFTAFDNIIPKDAKYIYVLSDHPSRAVNSPYTGRCALILQNLFQYLKERHPQATIVVKRGGDLFLDYARLSQASVTICSASSFCLWPAISNHKNKVYFPLTNVAGGADSIELAPNFGTHFNWIVEPKIISNFKNLRPWTAIIDVLLGKAPMP